MLSEKEIEDKTVDGDGLYLHGHKVKVSGDNRDGNIYGYAWEVILKAPELRNWEAYQAHKGDPAAQYAFVLSMIAWAGSDMIVVPPTPREAFIAIRTRFVGVAEAITSTELFLQFVGLEAHEFEK